MAVPKRHLFRSARLPAVAMARPIFLTSVLLVFGILAALNMLTNTIGFIAQPHQALAARTQPDWARVATTSGASALFAFVEQQQALAVTSVYDSRQGTAANVLVGVCILAVVL